MDRIECEIDRWEGRHNNKKHMKEIQAEQKRHYRNNHDAEASRKHPHHFTRERPNRKILSEKQDTNCNNWECFYEEQKKNAVLPTIGNMLRTLDDGSWRQKLRRIKDHKRGNTKVGVSNHTENVTPETKRPKSARAA